MGVVDKFERALLLRLKVALDSRRLIVIAGYSQLYFSLSYSSFFWFSFSCKIISVCE